jgi:hypothetical protein
MVFSSTLMKSKKRDNGVTALETGRQSGKVILKKRGCSHWPSRQMDIFLNRTFGAMRQGLTE